MRPPRRTNPSARALPSRPELLKWGRSMRRPYNLRLQMPGATTDANRQMPSASCWIFRITHGPRSIADGPSLRFLSAEITLRLLNGGVRHLSKKRDATGQICCRGNKMELLEVLIHSMRGGSRAAEQLLRPRASARREDL